MRFFLGVLVLGLCVVGTSTPAAAYIVDDFDTNDPGNYAMLEIYAPDGVPGFGSDGSVFTPDSPNQTEGWLWTGSDERLDVGETVSLDFVTVDPAGEAALLLSTADVPVAGTAILEFRQTAGYNGYAEQVARPAVHGGGASDDWAFGADIFGVLTPDALAPATISVTRTTNTQFDWAVTGATSGAGTVEWLDAGASPLFFGMDVYNAGATTLDNLSIVPEPSTFALLGMGALGLLVFGWRRKRA